MTISKLSSKLLTLCNAFFCSHCTDVSDWRVFLILLRCFFHDVISFVSPDALCYVSRAEAVTRKPQIENSCRTEITPKLAVFGRTRHLLCPWTETVKPRMINCSLPTGTTVENYFTGRNVIHDVPVTKVPWIAPQYLHCKLNLVPFYAQC